MEDKQLGKAKGKKEFRNIEEEYDGSLYRIPGTDEVFGIPAGGLKKCAVSACALVGGIKATLAKKIFHIVNTEPGNLVRIDGPGGTEIEPVMDESVVRVGPWGNRVAMTRYRGKFEDWEMTFDVEFMPNLISAEMLLNLFEHAGFGVGLCENRPEKSGENWGRFEVKKA